MTLAVNDVDDEWRLCYPRPAAECHNRENWEIQARECGVCFEGNASWSSPFYSEMCKETPKTDLSYLSVAISVSSLSLAWWRDDAVLLPASARPILPLRESHWIKRRTIKRRDRRETEECLYFPTSLSPDSYSYSYSLSLSLAFSLSLSRLLTLKNPSLGFFFLLVGSGCTGIPWPSSSCLQLEARAESPRTRACNIESTLLATIRYVCCSARRLMLNEGKIGMNSCPERKQISNHLANCMP